jgi:hypothetical protein
MIDYKNYKNTNKNKNKERSDCVNKNSILSWVIFTVITVLLWEVAIKTLFR